MLFLGQGQEAPPCPARRGPPGPAAEAPTHLCDLYGLRQGDLRHGRGGGGGDGGPGVAVLLAGGVLLHRGGQQLRLRLRLLQQQLLLGRRQRELGGTGHVSGRGAGGAEPPAGALRGTPAPHSGLAHGPRPGKKATNQHARTRGPCPQDARRNAHAAEAQGARQAAGGTGTPGPRRKPRLGRPLRTRGTPCHTPPPPSRPRTRLKNTSSAVSFPGSSQLRPRHGLLRHREHRVPTSHVTES